MGQVLDILANASIIDRELAVRMKKAAGFRNAVHNYETINWVIVHSIAKYRLADFAEFAKAIAKFVKSFMTLFKFKSGQQS